MNSPSDSPSKSQPGDAIVRGEKLSSIAYRKIEAMILSGRLTCGERLNEHHLAEQFGLSRGPIREACRMLEAAGLVEATPNRGVSVRRVDAVEMAENYDLRALLTGFMCALAARNADDSQIMALQSAIEPMESAASKADIASYYDANLAFHDLIADVAGNGTARRLYDGLIKETHSLRVFSLSPDTSNVEHRAMVAAIAERDADKAQALGEDHVLAGKRRWMERSSADPAKTSDTSKKGETA